MLPAQLASGLTAAYLFGGILLVLTLRSLVQRRLFTLCLSYILAMAAALLYLGVLAHETSGVSLARLISQFLEAPLQAHSDIYIYALAGLILPHVLAGRTLRERSTVAPATLGPHSEPRPASLPPYTLAHRQESSPTDNGAPAQHRHAPRMLPESSPGLAATLTLASLGILRFFTVPQGWTTTIIAFGRYRRTARPGLRCCWGILGLYERVSLSVQTTELISQCRNDAVFTSDGVRCSIDIVLYYRVSNVEKALYGIERHDFCGAVETLVQAVLRNECGRKPTSLLLSSRDEMSQRIKDTLERETEPWGVQIRLAEISTIRMNDRASKG